METTTRSMWWSVTINNPTGDDEELIALARQAGWRVEGQLEKGEAGTPHYQLAVKSPGQVRFSAVKKRFPRAHIEAAREPSALKKYVVKEETRVAQLPTTQELYPSLSKYWELIADEIYAWNPYILDCWEDPKAFEWSASKAGMALPGAVEAMNEATSRLIMKGYHVETLAANPGTISSWKKFHVALCRRVSKERVERERMAQANASEAEETVSVPLVNHAPHLQAPPPPPPPCPQDRRTSPEGNP